MRRKIPGRKHRGVRDPEKQRAQRLKSIKHKINAPPTDPDDQQIPRSLQRLAQLQVKVRNGDFARKKAKKPRPRERFEQHPNESEREFLLRVHRECDAVKHEAAFEQKFGVEVKRNELGEVESVEKRKDPLKVMLKEVRREKKKKKGKGDEARLTKSQKRQLKLAEKKKKKLESKVDEFEKFRDKVKFGEQVHAPPTLTLPKRVTATNVAPRPGKRDLLLKSVLGSSKTSNTVIDRTAKRKNLPTALRRQLDKQQQEVVQAYRLLKEKKHGTL
ncbi:coiled-coil domain-containing protein 137 [Asbolus verrucosus]|uniref:Coiled-coil domain-containing protein 137 n=1 Tax=Asbolus verrucosus TaxID=1661398 RepID=A0A482VC80_ASBVE|nr:coiled-coil domain-containing protein 137 [Asbolus verrucosus]